jgi:hypothetical protein
MKNRHLLNHMNKHFSGFIKKRLQSKALNHQYCIFQFGTQKGVLREEFPTFISLIKRVDVS